MAQMSDTDEKIKAKVKRCFGAQGERFYLVGIIILVKRWRKRIDLKGNNNTQIKIILFH